MYEWMYISSPTSIVRTCKSSSLISMAGIGREGKGGGVGGQREKGGRKERKSVVCVQMRRLREWAILNLYW